MLLGFLVGFAQQYGPWHLDDDVSDIVWSGKKPDDETIVLMQGVVDDAFAHFDKLLPRKPVNEDWGLWRAIQLVPFYPSIEEMGGKKEDD